MPVLQKPVRETVSDREFAVLDELGADVKLSQIRAALEQAKSLPAAKAQATKIADRLDTGVRVVLLGPEGVGKSQLCNALLQINQEADEPGGTRVFAGPDIRDASELRDDHPKIHERHVVDTRRLGRVQVIDVSVPHSEQHDLAAECAQFLPLADIVLWCTECFSEKEQHMWADASDPLKDHSFLVLTKADLLAEQGSLAVRIAELQRVVAEEFHSLFPTTTTQLQQLLEQGTDISDAQLAASGVKALTEAVRKIVQSGERADRDGALLFLERHGITLDAAMPHEENVAVASASKTATPMNTNYKRARDMIMERAIDLAEMTFDADQGDMSEMLAFCGEISEELVEIVTSDTANSEDEQHWHDVFEQASDKVMLMTMENDLRSAADAVTILLQLRRDLEAMTVH